MNSSDFPPLVTRHFENLHGGLGPVALQEYRDEMVHSREELMLLLSPCSDQSLCFEAAWTWTQLLISPVNACMTTGRWAH